MFWPGWRAKRMKSFAWFLSCVMILSLAAPITVAAEINETTETSSIAIDLRATGMGGDVFEAAAYEVPAGEVTVGSHTLDRHTAMGALAYYCEEENINIEITEGTYGLFVNQVGTDPDDTGSWMYYVNESSPWVGAAVYDLSPGDAVHFVNFNLNLYSLSLSLDVDEIEPGDSLTATVLYTDGSGDSTAVEGAEVFVSDAADEFGNPVAPGEPVGQTDASGELTFTWDEPGTFYPYAQWNGKSTQYQWPVASFSVAGPEKVIISTETNIAVGDLAPTVEISLSGDVFGEDSAVQDPDNWLIDAGATGLTLAGIEKMDDQRATIAFNGTAGAGTMRIQANSGALAGEADSNEITLVVREAHEIDTAAAITKTIAWYHTNYPAPGSWEGLSALWGAGEDVNESPWQATQAWREVDPGFSPDTAGSEHIANIFRLLSVKKNPAEVWDGRNLLAELAAQQGQDDGSLGTIGKHIWAILALDVGENLGLDVGSWDDESSRQAALDHLLDQQNLDGSFAPFSQLDHTGWALTVLSNYQGKGEAEVDDAISAALDYLKTRQKENAGFNPPPGSWGPEPENANSNAAVLSGLIAVGEDIFDPGGGWVKNGSTVLDALLKFQQDDGSFWYTETIAGMEKMSTVQALLALVDLQHGASTRHRMGRELSFLYSNAVVPVDAVDPAVTVKLVGDEFLPGAADPINWAIDPGTSGLTVSGFVQNNPREMVINFGGTARAGTVSIKALAAALAGNAPSNAVALTIAQEQDLPAPGNGGGTSPPPSDTEITVYVEVIGKQETHFAGSVKIARQGANALEALKATGVSYKTRDGDNYVYEIAGEAEDITTTAGWKYSVNGAVPGVPAKSSAVADGDEVIWFWADDAGATAPRSGGPPLETEEAQEEDEEEAAALLEAGLQEMVSAVREHFAPLLAKLRERLPVEIATQQVQVLETGEPMSEEEKEALREQLQHNIVSLSLPVDPREDTLVHDRVGEILLHIHEGALSESTEITVEEISTENLPTSPTHVPLSSAYRLGPKGTVFSEPVVLSIRLAMPDGQDPAELILAWLDEEKGQWYALPTLVDLSSGYLSAPVPHFTPFAVLAREKPFQAFEDVTEAAFAWAYPQIHYLAAREIVLGVGDNRFQPGREVTRAEFAAMLVRALGLEAGDHGEMPFEDISPAAWYAAPVRAAAAAGIVKGVTPTAFHPHETITREQMAVMLSRADRTLEVRGDLSPVFTDAASISPWARDEVAQMAARELLQGFPDGTFQPRGAVTRAQAAVVLYRLLLE